MAPISSSYVLRSRGLPIVTMERPTHTRKISTEVAENEEIEAIQANVDTKEVIIGAFQPVINAQNQDTQLQLLGTKRRSSS